MLRTVMTMNLRQEYVNRVIKEAREKRAFKRYCIALALPKTQKKLKELEELAAAPVLLQEPTRLPLEDDVRLIVRHVKTNVVAKSGLF